MGSILHSRTQQELPVNNILDIHSFSDRKLAAFDNHSQSTPRTDFGLSHIQLRKGLSGQIQTSHAHGLALCLVYGHREGWPEGDLPALELEREC